MKNFQKVIPIIIVLIFTVPIIAYSQTICSFDNCNNKRSCLDNKKQQKIKKNTHKSLRYVIFA